MVKGLFIAEELSNFERAVQKIFEEKTSRFGIEKIKLDLKLTTIRGPPVVEENAYGEAFPFEKPPRVWLEIFPLDVTTKEISKVISHELVHIKYPKLVEEGPEFKKMVKNNMKKKTVLGE